MKPKTDLTVAAIDSPLGEILLSAENGFLTGLWLSPIDFAVDRPRDDSPVLAAAREQLAAYFRGERTEFDLPIQLRGTPFQRRAWEELTRIPYGTTISYGEQARRLGNDKAARAVGGANGRNPIAIIVPCHRVIGGNGGLTGYGGGLDVKLALLTFEESVTKLGPRPMQRLP